LSAEARWRLPFVTADGQLITFQFDARGDVYRVENNDLADFGTIPEKTQYIERGLPYAAVDWRWPLISGSRRSDSFLIEPIVQGIVAPYGGNPAGLPVEDADAFEFDDNNIFSVNQLPGYDLVESGPRANVGLHAVSYFGAGSIDALIGQVYRLKPDPIFADTSGLKGDVSDIVSLVTIKFPPYLELANRLDIDDSTGTVRRNEVYVQASYDRSSFEVSYVRLPSQPSQGLPVALTDLDEPREEVTAQAIVGLFDHWSIYAAGQRDLRASQLLESDFGIGYDDECLGLSVAYRRLYSSDRDIPPSTSVIVHLIPKFGNEPEDLFDLFPHQIFTPP
jgi:LPS-assembly protein